MIARDIFRKLQLLSDLRKLEGVCWVIPGVLGIVRGGEFVTPDEEDLEAGISELLDEIRRGEFEVDGFLVQVPRDDQGRWHPMLAVITPPDPLQLKLTFQ